MELIVSILAVLISVISLISTIRKKEFGEFLFVQTERPSEIWIRVVKSNLYDVCFEFEEKHKPNRIKILKPNELKDDALWFDSSHFDDFRHAVIDDNSILKLTYRSDLKVQITFCDRFNNKYCQLLDEMGITKRKHLNPFNFTFGDSSFN